MYRPKMTWLSKLIWTLLLIGFAFMVFPGVFIFHERAEPFIFGMPFTYGYIIFWWAYMCIILLIAPKINWGAKKKEKEVSDE